MDIYEMEEAAEREMAVISKENDGLWMYAPRKTLR